MTSSKGWTWAVGATIGSILLSACVAFTALSYLACPREASPLPGWAVARAVDWVVWLNDRGIRPRCPRCRQSWIIVTLLSQSGKQN